MATIKLVHWLATRFHPFNQHLAGEFMRTLPGGRLSILPESSGVLQSKSPASGGIVVTVQHNLPCPRSPIMAIPVGVCIAPCHSENTRKNDHKSLYRSFTSTPPVTNAWVCWFPALLSKQFVSLRANWRSYGAHLLISDIEVDLICWPPQVFSLRSLVLGLGSYSLSLIQLWTCDKDLGRRELLPKCKHALLLMLLLCSQLLSCSKCVQACALLLCDCAAFYAWSHFTLFSGPSLSSSIGVWGLGTGCLHASFSC